MSQVHQIIIARPQCFTSRSPLTLLKGSLFVVPETEMVFYQTRLCPSLRISDIISYYGSVCVAFWRTSGLMTKGVCAALWWATVGHKCLQAPQKTHITGCTLFLQDTTFRSMLYCMPHKARSALQFPQITVITQQLPVCSNDKSSISGNIRKVKIGRVVIIQTWTE